MEVVSDDAAANDPHHDPDAFRYLFIAGEPGKPGYVRQVILAETRDEAWEKADLMHKLALSQDLAPAIRPLTCKDPEAAVNPWLGEHAIREVDPLRDPDAKAPHFRCSRCGRCEWNAEDFAA